MLQIDTLRHSYIPRAGWKDSISTQTPTHAPRSRGIPLLTLRHLPSPRSPHDSGTLEGVLLSSQQDFCTPQFVRRHARKTNSLAKRSKPLPEAEKLARILNESDTHLHTGTKARSKKRRSRLASPLNFLRRSKQRSARPDVPSVLGKGYYTPTGPVRRMVSLASPLHSTPPKSFRTMRRLSRPKPKSTSLSVERDFVCWPGTALASRKFVGQLLSTSELS